MMKKDEILKILETKLNETTEQPGQVAVLLEIIAASLAEQADGAVTNSLDAANNQVHEVAAVVSRYTTAAASIFKGMAELAANDEEGLRAFVAQYQSSETTPTDKRKYPIYRNRR